MTLEQEEKYCHYALAVVLLMFFLLFCFSTTKRAKGQDATNADLDLPVLPPTYRSPEETALQLIPDVAPPLQPVEDEDPEDAEPVIFYGEEIHSENDTIYYVLDMSCSMGWDEQSYETYDGQIHTGPRVDRAKAELERSIRGLSPNIRFGILVYTCALFGWGDGYVLREATNDNKASALSWLALHNPQGGTASGPAVGFALSCNTEIMSVVLLTDGAPNCGVNDFYPVVPQHREMIRSNNTRGAIINVFGVAAGYEQRTFCQQVAADSGGTYVELP